LCDLCLEIERFDRKSRSDRARGGSGAASANVKQHGHYEHGRVCAEIDLVGRLLRLRKKAE
jgi:hypothetical protein